MNPLFAVFSDVRNTRLALGASGTQIRARVAGASGYRDNQFHNSEPSVQFAPADPDEPSIARSMLRRGRLGRPAGPVPVHRPQFPARAGQLVGTWLGHATVLVELDGARILTDPVWSQRVSPSQLVGPARMHPVPVDLRELPQLDAIVISHDHYDHLDTDTIQQLARNQLAPFVVPLGVGAHLRRWGVPGDRIHELSWGASIAVGDITIRCTEARHFSGRGLRRNNTLWASFVFQGPTRRVYFGGDTGYTRAFAKIGAEHGPFDLTLLPIGAYDPHWPDIHMNPEEAVQAHREVGGAQGLLLPIHWGTFNLAFHPWAQPPRRLLAAAAESGVEVRVPEPGQRIEVARPPAQKTWWDEV